MYDDLLEVRDGSGPMIELRGMEAGTAEGVASPVHPVKEEWEWECGGRGLCGE